MNNPCYNKETKTDCPDRKAGCGGSCPKWAEYERIRNEGYKDEAKRKLGIPYGDSAARESEYTLKQRVHPRAHRDT